MYQQEIKIVRFKSGEDVVAELTEGEYGRIVMKNPMEVKIIPDRKLGKNIVYMQQWLPVTILAQNQTEVFETDILSVMHPSDEFTTYYINMALNVETLLESDEELDDDDGDLLSQVEEAKILNQIH
jgi:hypothetical protein